MGPTRILGRLRHRGVTSRIGSSIRRTFRRPPLYWTAVGVIAFASAAMVWAALRDAQRGAELYGAPREVLVAARDLAVGARIEPTDVVRRRFPAAALPPSALGELPAGAVAGAAIDSGEVVTSRHLGRRNASPSALRVLTGRRGVAVPRGTDALPLRVGDTVDVAVAPTGSPGLEDSGGGAPSMGAATLLARQAPVISVDVRVAVVSVEEKVAAELAVAAADGRAQLVLVGADDRGET